MTFKGSLYGFQEPALKRMLDRRQLLLALEMGLGKSVITIAACEELLDTGEIATAIIVCPASLKYQWKRMIEKFGDDEVTITLMDGPPTRRQRLYTEVLTEQPDYLILNYEQVVNDWKFIKSLPMDCVVCDEVQAIKSFRAKRSRRVKRMRATYRFGLTGQPVENMPEEVFSILQWIDPDVMGHFEVFERTFIRRNSYGGVTLYRNLPVLRRRLTEVMVRKRRDDPDVVEELPKVQEEIVPVEFDAAGARLYRHIARDLMTELATVRQQYGNFNVFRHYNPMAGEEEMKAMGRVMSRLTCLRFLCDHPQLLLWSAAKYGEGRGTGSEYAHELASAGHLKNVPQWRAPKFDATVELVNDIVAAGHKVVVFSFFKESLNLLRDRLEVHRPALFTGDMSARDRDKSKMKFALDDHCRLFLSSDAGGVGLDLPEASYLINFNLPWSAGKFDQRQARIIRLSSEWKAVTLATVMMAGSIEERMYGLLAQKRAIADAVVDGRGIDAKGQLRLTLDSLTEFLASSTV